MRSTKKVDRTYMWEMTIQMMESGFFVFWKKMRNFPFKSEMFLSSSQINIGVNLCMPLIQIGDAHHEHNVKVYDSLQQPSTGHDQTDWTHDQSIR